jgi:curved DNA-binding protein CbpA
VTEENSKTTTENTRRYSVSIGSTPNYYEVLGLQPTASPIDIRRVYRDLSKRYHPDTTNLPQSVATVKFQQLNEAYAALSNPERRVAYDEKIRLSRLKSMPYAPKLMRDSYRANPSRSSAYLDPIDRPLSSGEIFALFIMGITILGCLCLAIGIALLRGDPL